jgi:hypothetical protein
MPYIGNTVQTQGFTPAIDYFNGNGVTVTFTLSRPVASVAQMIVAIDNVIQNPSSSYTVSGSSITFTSAPLSGTNNIWVEYTSLITTYAAISQDPSVIGDITASGGYLAVGDFGNTFVDGTIVDYVTGNARITTGPADGLTIYNGGTTARTALAAWDASGNLTNTGGAVIQGLTVGKGAGAIAYNTALGLNTLSSNTTGGDITAIGGQALKSNTTGVINSALGVNALYTNTTGNSDTALGHSALFLNTTGSNNTAVGTQSLYSNTTASNNTAVGYQALYSSATSTGNTAFGYRALYSHNGAGGSYLNCAIGNAAGAAITGGYVNCILGADSTANSLTSGAYNTYIGTCDASSGGVSYELVVAATNPKVVGKGGSTGFINPNGGGVYQGNNSATWSITSDVRLKKNIVNNNTGLDLINQIQVRNFEYRLPEEITELEPTSAISRTGIQLGVIAQEIKQVSEEFVKTESTGVMSVDTDNLVWYLINAVKELNAKVTALEAQLESK